MTEDTIQLTDRSQKIKLYPYTRTSEVLDVDNDDRPLKDTLGEAKRVLNECQEAAESVVIINGSEAVHSESDRKTTVTLKSTKGATVCSFDVPDSVGSKGDTGDTGPQGPQGPAGPSYDDTAIKQRATDLETKTTGVTRSDDGHTLIDGVDVASKVNNLVVIDNEEV